PPAPPLPHREHPRQQLPHAPPLRALPGPPTPRPRDGGRSTEAEAKPPGGADALTARHPRRVGHFQSPQVGHSRSPLTPRLRVSSASEAAPRERRRGGRAAAHGLTG